MSSKVKGLMQRFKDGETVIMAEGYIFEFERRAYLQAGCFVPIVVLEHPELVKASYREFADAGSDVVLAFTYYGHRAKLETIGKGADVEALNRKALKMAKEVADETGTLMGGNICNTGVFDPKKPESIEKAKLVNKEQIEWAVEEGADLILAETYTLLSEAMVALESMKEHGNGLPMVVNLSPSGDGHTFDEPRIPIPEACKRLREAGADVVGINCFAGPDTMIPIMREIKKAVDCPIACIPVPYRTDPKDKPLFWDFKDYKTGKKAFPDDLEAWLCSRSHIDMFTREAQEIGVNLLGICCGNQACFTRTMAEALGRKPKASNYSKDMSKHITELRDDEGRSHTYNILNPLRQ